MFEHARRKVLKGSHLRPVFGSAVTHSTCPEAHVAQNPRLGAVCGDPRDAGDGPFPAAPTPGAGSDVRPRTDLAAGDEGYDDVGGVAVEVLAAPVVHRGRPGVSVTGGDLDFA